MLLPDSLFDHEYHQPRTLEIEHFLGVDEVAEVGNRLQIKYNTMDPNDPFRIARQHDFIEIVDPTPAMPIVSLTPVLYEF